MGLPIYVDAYSGYKANERSIRFHLDEDFYEIDSVVDHWHDPNAEYLRLRRQTEKYICSGTNREKMNGRCRADLMVMRCLQGRQSN